MAVAAMRLRGRVWEGGHVSSTRTWSPFRRTDGPSAEPSRPVDRSAAAGPSRHPPQAEGTGVPGVPAVVVICDPNYVIPTLATALSAERHVKAGNVRIYLFVVGADPEMIGRIQAAAGTRIRVRSADLPRFADYARNHRDRYLPAIALARFWLGDLLDPEVDRFLYIDGDVMVDGELDSLLAAPPPDGRLMAAPDALSIYIDETISRGRRHDLAYLAGLCCPSGDYFNSGVMYVSRATWAEIVPVAKAFLLEHPERCRSSDQSALNFAARGRLGLLPLRYNYQSEHMMAFDPRDRGMRPTIWHFSSAPKPWDAAGWPWEGAFARDYAEAAARLDGGVPAPTPPPAQIQAGLEHRRRARLRLAWVFPWRRMTRRRRILEMY